MPTITHDTVTFGAAQTATGFIQAIVKFQVMVGGFVIERQGSTTAMLARCESNGTRNPFGPRRCRPDKLTLLCWRILPRVGGRF